MNAPAPVLAVNPGAEVYTAAFTVESNGTTSRLANPTAVWANCFDNGCRVDRVQISNTGLNGLPLGPDCGFSLRFSPAPVSIAAFVVEGEGRLVFPSDDFGPESSCVSTDIDCIRTFLLDRPQRIFLEGLSGGTTVPAFDRQASVGCSASPIRPSTIRAGRYETLLSFSERRTVCVFRFPQPDLGRVRVGLVAGIQTRLTLEEVASTSVVGTCGDGPMRESCGFEVDEGSDFYVQGEVQHNVDIEGRPENIEFVPNWSGNCRPDPSDPWRALLDNAADLDQCGLRLVPRNPTTDPCEKIGYLSSRAGQMLDLQMRIPGDAGWRPRSVEGGVALAPGQLISMRVIGNVGSPYYVRWTALVQGRTQLLGFGRRLDRQRIELPVGETGRVEAQIVNRCEEQRAAFDLFGTP